MLTRPVVAFLELSNRRRDLMFPCDGLGRLVMRNASVQGICNRGQRMDSDSQKILHQGHLVAGLITRNKKVLGIYFTAWSYELQFCRFVVGIACLLLQENLVVNKPPTQPLPNGFCFPSVFLQLLLLSAAHKNESVSFMECCRRSSKPLNCVPLTICTVGLPAAKSDEIKQWNVLQNFLSQIRSSVLFRS